MHAQVADARGRLAAAARVVVLTGAGISTDSGLQDFGDRGPRMLLALGQRVHAALAGLQRRKLPALPKQWTRATREAFLADLQKALKG